MTFKWRWKKIIRKIIKNIFLIIIVPGILLFGWYRLQIPLKNVERNYFGIRIQNTHNRDCEINLEIEYILELDKSFLPRENISDSYSLAKKSPFRIEFTIHSNITIQLLGLSPLQYFWKGINVPFHESSWDAIHIHWFKSEYPLDNEKFTLYIDGAITHPETDLFAINMDTIIVEKTSFNHSFILDHKVILSEIDEKKTHLESSNVKFSRISDSYEGASFEDISRDEWNEGEIQEIITNIDLEFSTFGSRLRANSSLIILALVVEIPIVLTLDWYRQWRKKREETEKEISKSKKQKSEEKEQQIFPSILHNYLIQTWQDKQIAERKLDHKGPFSGDT